MPPPLRLLILEDQVILRKLISRQTGFFSRQATIIDEFSDPAEALRSAAENRYDLIITDIGIPGMSGIDFIKNLTAIGCRASLLIISGYDSRILHAIVRMARGQGMPSVHFLCKPYSIDQFLHQLNAVFANMEQQAGSTPLDPQQLWRECAVSSLALEFRPVLDDEQRQLRAVQVEALQLPSSLLPLDAGFYRQLASNPQLPVLILEMVMERLVQVLVGIPHSLRQHIPFLLYLDVSCLAHDNVFDRYVALLRQHGLLPGQVGFLLADGLQAHHPPVCYENIAKLKYFGFHLLAEQLGEGSLTVSNLLGLPLDGVRVAAATVQQWSHQQQSLLALLQCCGLTTAQLTMTQLDDEADLVMISELSGCNVSGEQIALQLGEGELSSYLEQPQTAGTIHG